MNAWKLITSPYKYVNINPVPLRFNRRIKSIQYSQFDVLAEFADEPVTLPALPARANTIPRIHE